jgi:hypothetical protein
MLIAHNLPSMIEPSFVTYLTGLVSL